MNIKFAIISYLCFISVGYAGKLAYGRAASPSPIEIKFIQHRFVPERVEVPAGVPLEIRVVNASRERIEFESFKLNREKVVEPGDTIAVPLPALRAGSYDFYDDFHSDVPEGTIVAR